MSAAPDWIAHRRGDGELLGWMAPDGERFRVIDLLGHDLAPEPLDWLEAEELLEATGIGYLADRYELAVGAGKPRRVRIGEVSSSRIVVVADDFGAASAVGAHPERIELPFPAPEGLRRIG